MLEWIRFAASAVLTLLGLFVLITGVLGTFRFRQALNRIHAAALLDTVGILCMFGGLIVALGFTLTSLKLLIVVLFLWLTSPVSSHLIGELVVVSHDGLAREINIDDPEAVQQLKEGHK